MGIGFSGPEEPKLPNGKKPPFLCPQCKVISCEHRPDGFGTARSIPLDVANSVAATAPPVAAYEDAVVPAAPAVLRESDSTSSLERCEYEDISKSRREIKIPELITNMVEFCRSVLECHRKADGDALHFDEELGRLEKRAQRLIARHECIEQNKNKGVLIPEFVAAHRKEVVEWLADCERFNQSYYSNQTPLASTTANPVQAPPPEAPPPPPPAPVNEQSLVSNET